MILRVDASARVRAAAEEAGRDPDSLAICVAAPAYVGDDLAHAREQCRWFGGMVGNHVADLVRRYGEDGEIPEALTDYIRAREGYDYSPPRARRQPRHGVRARTRSSTASACSATAEDHVAKLRELESLGVDPVQHLPHARRAWRRRSTATAPTVIPAFAA